MLSGLDTDAAAAKTPLLTAVKWTRVPGSFKIPLQFLFRPFAFRERAHFDAWIKDYYGFIKRRMKNQKPLWGWMRAFYLPSSKSKIDGKIWSSRGGRRLKH